MDSTSANKEKEWKLEESSLWWLGLDIWKHPGNVLLLTSLPFCAGAYFGYKKPSEKLEKLAGAAENLTEQELLADGRRLGLQTAGRALRLGTLGAVGTFGMIGAGELVVC
jgi:hypothetical protein